MYSVISCTRNLFYTDPHPYRQGSNSSLLHGLWLGGGGRTSCTSSEPVFHNANDLLDDECAYPSEQRVAKLRGERRTRVSTKSRSFSLQEIQFWLQQTLDQAPGCRMVLGEGRLPQRPCWRMRGGCWEWRSVSINKGGESCLLLCVMKVKKTVEVISDLSVILWP